jgi:hypothetical protein
VVGEPDAISAVGSVKFYSRPALLAFLISWAMSSRLASLPLLGKERLLFLLGTNHFLHQRLETRIATERIELRISFNHGDG